MTGQPDTCLISWCDQERVEGALVCGSTGNRHLDDLWAGRLKRLADGTYILTAGPQPRWLARASDPDGFGATMGNLTRDFTGAARDVA